MPASSTRSPKAATCEEVDEATQTVKPGSQTSANVSKKRSQSSDLNTKSKGDKQSQHGSDSGYSSKAGTNESMASTYKRSNPLTVNTNITERSSRPYTHTPAKSEPSIRPSSAKIGTSKEKGNTSETRFTHAPGKCISCDAVGYHCELTEIQSILAAQKAAKVTKQGKSAADKPSKRRASSNVRDVPKAPMMIPSSPQIFTPVFVPEPAYVYHHGPPTPISPSAYFPPYPYTYDTTTPVAAPCPQCVGVVEGGHHHPMTPQYVEQPTMAYPQYHDPHHIHHQSQRPSNELERTVSYTARPRSATSNPSRKHADKIAMPPPPKPGLRRLSTEGHTDAARRASVHYDDEERPMVNSKRTSRDLSSYGPPPSAWKGSSYAEVERPRNRKSASYSDGSTDNSASAYREPLSRRATDPVDERTAQAEAYQAKVSRGSAGILTTEALRKLEKQRPLASESGTVQSKDSARGKRSSTVMSNSGRTTITVDGGIQISIPQDMTDQELNLQIGRLTVSTNRDKEQKRIERAPSNASRDSRRAPSGGSVAGEPETSKATVRKVSQTEKSKNSPPSSKRSSRAPSVSRQESELRKGRDSPESPEDYYGQ